MGRKVDPLILDIDLWRRRLRSDKLYYNDAMKRLVGYRERLQREIKALKEKADATQE